jgi:hypothetical protein
MGWAIIWALFSQVRLVTLIDVKRKEPKNVKKDHKRPKIVKKDLKRTQKC